MVLPYPIADMFPSPDLPKVPKNSYSVTINSISGEGDFFWYLFLDVALSQHPNSRDLGDWQMLKIAHICPKIAQKYLKIATLYLGKGVNCLIADIDESSSCS